jgi:hypothetical protein
LAVALAPRHYFYDRCNEVLAEAEFDEAVEMLCQWILEQARAAGLRIMDDNTSR